MREAQLERWLPRATTLLALFAMRPAVPPPPAAAAAVPPPPIIVPSVIVIPGEPPAAPIEVTTIVEAPRDDLACPVPPRSDDAAIGVPAELGPFVDDDKSRATIAVSAAAPVIAIARADGHVRASTDDGRTFTDVFAGETVDSIAVDDRGRIYAIAGDRFGVRDLRGRERWIDADTPCPRDSCTDRVVAAGDAVAWIRAGAVRTTADGGRTWRVLDDEPGDELANAQHLGYWKGTLYGLGHVSDMCGWEADQIARLDVATKRYAFTSFDNDAQSPKLDVIGDTGATWTYRARAVHGDLAARNLRLATLAPAFGPRLLWAAEGQLYELCGDRGRIVAHSYGAPRVDAVDAAGRPLIADGDRVLRWSPRFGWRELDRAPPQPAAAGD